MNNFDDLLTNAPAEGQRQLSKEDWVAKKQAERDAVFGLSDDAALAVAEDGGSFQQFLDVQATFGRYSAVNALLIYAQQELLPGKTATRIGDFDHWKGQGCNVKPGQKSISILEPHEYIKDDGTPGNGYNVKKVFEISQVDTRKHKAKPSPSYSERQILAALVKSAPVAIVGVENLPDNVGAQRHDNRIEVKKGMGFEDTFRSLALEVCAVEAESQFSAYSAAYILCQKNGVDVRGFNFSDAPTMFEDMDAQRIKGELAGIRDCADDISGRMARNLGALEKASRNQEAR